MNRRSSLLCCATIGVWGASASAQTVQNPPIVASPPLVVPITPAPLDGKTQNALDANTPRTFHIRLRHVKPSTMAFWLDPKHNPAPLELQNQAIIKVPHFKEGDALNIPSPLARDFQLPSGILRVVAVDAQNVLLISGTPKGVAQLQQVITFLDRPARPQTVEFEAQVFWIDSLAMDSQILAQSALIPRAERIGELSVLKSLERQDRAALRVLPTQTGFNQTALSFVVAPFVAARAPLFNFNYDIDPGIQARGLGISSKPKPGELRLTPILTAPTLAPGALDLLVQTSGATSFSVVVSVREGESLILSGSAKKLGLTPPSPRFDAFVLRVTPRVALSQTPAVSFSFQIVP